MSGVGTGMGRRVKGEKGGGERTSVVGRVGTENGEVCFSGWCAGAVEGRVLGLSFGGSRVVVGVGTGVAMAVTGRSSSSTSLRWDSGTASKLNGRRRSLGGGNGETGEISMSRFVSSGFRVGDGVISGVIVFKLGMGGAGRCAYS